MSKKRMRERQVKQQTVPLQNKHPPLVLRMTQAAKEEKLIRKLGLAKNPTPQPTSQRKKPDGKEP